ncbi:MAG: nucleotidyltransferase family protein [Hyphomicrobiales bacterium]|nr:nucleotidyltransferase family protein [Hyphomicrobiales bacterium]
MSHREGNIGCAAMILAAGHGSRMRPLTDTCPKPLIEVKGRSLIDRSVDRIREAGIEHVVVNMHYLADQIEIWAARQDDPPIILSDERASLLDTGGGVAKMLGVLGDGSFFVFNSDSFWVDGSKPALERMRSVWNDDDMDCVLLLADPARSVGFDGGADFSMDDAGRLQRFGGDGTGYIYCGCYLVSPRLFASAPDGAFSMNVLWNEALAKGRLFGLVHDGLWLHVGTPGAIKEAEDALDGQA